MSIDRKRVVVVGGSFGGVNAAYETPPAIAPPGPTPVPVAVPKTGHMSESMGQAAARNIAAEFAGGAKLDGLANLGGEPRHGGARYQPLLEPAQALREDRVR